MTKRFCFILMVVCYLLFTSGFTTFDDSTHQRASYKDSLLKVELYKIKYELLNKLMAERNALRVNLENNNSTFDLGVPLNVEMNESSYIFICANNIKAELPFQSLFEQKLKIYDITNTIQSTGGIEECKLKVGKVIISAYKSRKPLLVDIKDYLSQIQTMNYDIVFGINKFEEKLNEYYTTNPKPSVTELQRIYIIQADAAVKLYQYQKAIDLNNQVIYLHPTAYAKAYFNIAILQAETNQMFSAIYNMRKYLRFLTSENERLSISNMIRDWELILNN